MQGWACCLNCLSDHACILSHFPEEPQGRTPLIWPRYIDDQHPSGTGSTPLCSKRDRRESKIESLRRLLLREVLSHFLAKEPCKITNVIVTPAAGDGR